MQNVWKFAAALNLGNKPEKWERAAELAVFVSAGLSGGPVCVRWARLILHPLLLLRNQDRNLHRSASRVQRTVWRC